MGHQTDIFDRDDVWVTRHIDAFGAFIRSEAFVELGRYAERRRVAGKPIRPLKAESAAVYLHMFKNYLRWLDSRKLRLHNVSPADLMAFLDAPHIDENNRVRKVQSLIRVRYLRLLERVYIHLNIIPNPAQHAAFNIYKTTATGQDKPKAFLSEDEQARFLERLPMAPAFDPDDAAAVSWKRRRDRAMLAMMLGAGLKVSEVLTLRLDQIGNKEPDGSMRVSFPPATPKGIGHETVLRPFAVKHVIPWIEERRARKIPGSPQLLFPATLQANTVLHKATVYRRVKATFEQAGIDVERMGGRTLRNSFAVRELESGTSIELVKRFMGHQELRSTEKYLQHEMKERRPARRKKQSA